MSCVCVRYVPWNGNVFKFNWREETKKCRRRRKESRRREELCCQIYDALPPWKLNFCACRWIHKYMCTHVNVCCQLHSGFMRDKCCAKDTKSCTRHTRIIIIISTGGIWHTCNARYIPMRYVPRRIWHREKVNRCKSYGLPEVYTHKSNRLTQPCSLHLPL